MRDIYEHYKIELTTVGPVFVGNGRDYSKNEYIIDNGRVFILNYARFISYLEKNRLLAKYESFLLDNYDNLRVWLQKNNVSKLDYSKFVDNWYDCREIEKKHTINASVKDPYGNPYVPGSSLKGVLRTMLLALDISENPQKYSEIKKSVLEEIENANKINKYALSKNEKRVNDICFVDCVGAEEHNPNKMNSIIIGDSEPIDIKALSLYKKNDKLMDGNKSNILPIYREAIQPRKKICFDLTLDHGRSEEGIDITIDTIKRAVTNFSKMYYKFFLSKFSGIKYPGDDVIWLGGGSGFVSKTVIYALFGNDASNSYCDNMGVEATKRILDKQFSKHGHKKDTLTSPHTLKVTQDDYQYGQCRIRFIDD